MFHCLYSWLPYRKCHLSFTESYRGSECSKLSLEILFSVACLPLWCIRPWDNHNLYFKEAKIRCNKQHQTKMAMFFSVSNNRTTNSPTRPTLQCLKSNNSEVKVKKIKYRKESKAKLHLPGETCELWNTMLPRAPSQEIKLFVKLLK